MQDAARQQLLDALRRAERRMDAAESDVEYDAARQLQIVARANLEHHDSRRRAA
jgi:hypothetical protein